MDLGDKIKNIRYKYNISQEDMAKTLEINRNYLSRIETNKTLPSVEMLLKLAKTFNISIDSLLGVNASDKDKTKKISKINQYCTSLSSTELDFIINILSVMTNNTKQK